MILNRILFKANNYIPANCIHASFTPKENVTLAETDIVFI